MKKNIVSVLLVIVTSVSIFYSYYQKSQANICVERSIRLQKEIEENLDQSKLKEFRAQQQLAVTNSQLVEAIQQLQNCSGRIKKD